MEKKMENEMESRVYIRFYMGVSKIRGTLWGSQ